MATKSGKQSGPYFAYDPVANRATVPEVKYGDPVKPVVGESEGDAPAVAKLDGTAQTRSAANVISNTKPAASAAQEVGGIPSDVQNYDSINLGSHKWTPPEKTAGIGCVDMVAD